MRVQTMKITSLFIIFSALQVYGCFSNGANLNSKTLHIGFNGLNVVSKRNIYEDKSSLENSWLKTALKPEEFNSLSKTVDFKKQFIFVFSFGKRPNANGKIIINNIRYTTHPQSKFSSIDINLNIGIADKKECNLMVDVESYPFIVELVDRPENSLKLDVGSYGAFNFGDDCNPPIAGKATPE